MILCSNKTPIFLFAKFKTLKAVILKNYVFFEENCTIVGCYAVNSYNSLPKFRDSLSGPIYKRQESTTYCVTTQECSVLIY